MNFRNRRFMKRADWELKIQELRFTRIIDSEHKIKTVTVLKKHGQSYSPNSE